MDKQSSFSVISQAPSNEKISSMHFQPLSFHNKFTEGRTHIDGNNFSVSDINGSQGIIDDVDSDAPDSGTATRFRQKKTGKFGGDMYGDDLRKESKDMLASRSESKFSQEYSKDRKISDNQSPRITITASQDQVEMNKRMGATPPLSDRVVSDENYQKNANIESKKNPEKSKFASRRSGMDKLFSVIMRAARSGAIKGHAYHDILSKEQFFMIKDSATGKFDYAEQKRFQQLSKAKKNMMLMGGEGDGKRIKRTLWNKSKKDTLKGRVTASMKEILQMIKKRLTKVIPPNGKFRLFWDVFIMMLIFYDLIIVPLRFSFEFELSSGLVVLENLIIAFFLLDIVFNFSTGYYAKGLLVLERKAIVKHYLKGWFWIDIIASFPYAWIIPQSEEDGSGNDVVVLLRFVRFLRLIRLVRVLKLKRLFRKIESYLDLSAAFTSLLGFVKLSIIILFIAHWLACGWHLLAVFVSSEEPVTWLQDNGLIDEEWFDKYASSIYWATATMITVGFGDITPISREEQIFGIFSMIVASGVFAYTMNRMNYILSGLETSSEAYKQALSAITNYMKKKHVKKELQIKIKKYLEYALEVETSIDSNVSYLNNYLNESLKNELLYEIHGKILFESPLFQHFEITLLARLSNSVQEIFYSPEDTIFLEQEDTEYGVYFLNSGKIELFNQYSNSLIKDLQRGTHFGEISFFSGQPRSCSARSVDFSSLYVLKRDDFVELLEDFPFEKEKFCEIKDSINLYKDYRALGVTCYSCNQFGHTAKDCPKVHLVINKEEFIRAYNSKRDQFMRTYFRKGFRTNRNPDRYKKVYAAINQIQVKIWQKSLNIDKRILPDFLMDEQSQEMSQMPNFNRMSSMDKPQKIERASSEINNEGQSTTVKRFQRGVTVDSHETSKLKNKLKMVNHTNSDFITDTNKLQPPSHIPHILRQQNQTTSKPDPYNHAEFPFELGFDRVFNFYYYFPHNNVDNIFPGEMIGDKTMIFDYAVDDRQKLVKKPLYIKFIEKLKARVRKKKQQKGGVPLDRSYSQYSLNQQMKSNSSMSIMNDKRGGTMQNYYRSKSRGTFVQNINGPRPRDYSPRMLVPVPQQQSSRINIRSRTQIATSRHQLPSIQNLGLGPRVSNKQPNGFIPSYGYTPSYNNITPSLGGGSYYTPSYGHISNGGGGTYNRMGTYQQEQGRGSYTSLQLGSYSKFGSQNESIAASHLLESNGTLMD